MSKENKIKQRVCQIAIPTKFKLEDAKHLEFSGLCSDLEKIMKEMGVPFMLMSRVTGKYDKSRHLFYAVPYEKAEEIKQKIIDAELAEKVYADEY